MAKKLSRKFASNFPSKTFSKIQPINISSRFSLFFLSSPGFLFDSRPLPSPPPPFARPINFHRERFRERRTRSVTMDGLQTRVERKRGEKTGGMRIGAALIWRKNEEIFYAKCIGHGKNILALIATLSIIIRCLKRRLDGNCVNGEWIVLSSRVVSFLVWKWDVCFHFFFFLFIPRRFWNELLLYCTVFVL